MRRPLKILAIVAFLLLGTSLLVRVGLPFLQGIERTVDLTPYHPLLTNQSCRVRLQTIKVRWPWKSPFIYLRGTAALSNTNCRVALDALIESPWTWQTHVVLHPAVLTAEDAVLGRALDEVARLQPACRDLTGRLTVGVMAEAERGGLFARPSWRAQVRVTDGDFSGRQDAHVFALKGFRAAVKLRGADARIDVDPFFPAADEIIYDALTFTNFQAAVHKTERALLVTEGGAGFCGGEAKVYSLFLDPDKLHAGVTLFLENIDAGAALGLVRGFQGTASGRLHGKLPLRLRGGREVRVRDAFLYSTPGETGHLQLSDSTPIMDNLSAAGVDAATRQNLARALTDLDFTVLRLVLQQADTARSALTFAVEGTSANGDDRVPVTLNVTFRGDLNQLLNTGLHFNRKAKDL